MSWRNVHNHTPNYLSAAEDLRYNEGQWKAYESRGNCVVLAGPGSGKTKTLTIKMARMIHEDVRPPRGLACLTYNNECVRELRSRLQHLGIHGSQNIFIGTVHSFCLNTILLPYGRLSGLPLLDPLTVAKVSEQEDYFEQVVKITPPYMYENSPSYWTDAQRYRRTHLDRNTTDWKTENADMARLIEIYEHTLHSQGLIDFDDMVLLGLQLIEQHSWIRRLIKARYPILIIDEYQDLGTALDRIVRKLCFDTGIRLFAVGDPDQSIYGFTGARPELLEGLAREKEVELVILGINYRCGKKIVRASQITLQEERGYNTPESTHIGTIDFHDFPGGLRYQAQGICEEIIPAIRSRRRGIKLEDIAILYLSKNDGDIIAQTVEEIGISYIRIDRNAPYTKTSLIRWIESCAAWCSGGWSEGEPRLYTLIQDWLIFDRNISEEQFLRRQLVQFLWTYRTPDLILYEWLQTFHSSCLQHLFLRRSELRDEQEAFGRLIDACKIGGKLSHFTVATFAGQHGAPNHLNLITLHSAKGCEFDVVIMMGMDRGRIPKPRARDIREPRRLFYVGLTRAKYEVHLTFSGWTWSQNNTRQPRLGPSPFLTELQDNLLEN